MPANQILADRKLLDDLSPFHLIWLKSGELEYVSETAAAYFKDDSNALQSAKMTLYLVYPYRKVLDADTIKDLGQSMIEISTQPRGGRVVRGRLLKSETVGGWLFAGTPDGVDGDGLTPLAPLAISTEIKPADRQGVRVATELQDSSGQSQNSEMRPLGDVRLIQDSSVNQVDLESTLGELKRTQATLVQQERLKAVGEMVRGIAHDFSNILTPISAYSWLLKSQPNIPPAERDEYVDLIITATKDAHALIERLRRLYNPAHSSVEYSSFDINSLIQETLRLAQPRWAEPLEVESHSVDIIESLNAVGQMSAVETDIRQALLNLLYNAADAIDKNGVITVVSTSDDERIWISVGDDGSGMKPEVLDACATPFFTTKGEGGTGLGLPMVFETAVRHGGDVRIESGLGQGTRVTLCLPRRPLDDGAGEIHATSTAIAARLVTRVGLESSAVSPSISADDSEHELSGGDVLDALFEAALDPTMITQEVVYPPGAFTLEQAASIDIQRGVSPETYEPLDQQTSKSNDALNILVVDDDDAILSVLGRIIDTQGHTSYAAQNGSAALAFTDRMAFDLVICDLDMPGLKGDQLCIAINQASPGTKLIMFTGNPDGITAEACSVLDAIISKPSSPVDVIMRGVDLVYAGRNKSR